MQERQETRAPSLGWNNPLEEEMATPPVFLPGKSMDADGLQSMGSQRISPGVLCP